MSERRKSELFKAIIFHFFTEMISKDVVARYVNTDEWDHKKVFHLWKGLNVLGYCKYNRLSSSKDRKINSFRLLLGFHTKNKTTLASIAQHKGDFSLFKADFVFTSRFFCFRYLSCMSSSAVLIAFLGEEIITKLKL